MLNNPFHILSSFACAMPQDRKFNRLNHCFYVPLVLKLLEYPFQPFVRLIPVDDIPEGVNKLGSLVLVIQIIGMFPDIDNHQYGKHGINICVVFLYLHYYWSASLPAVTECCPSRAFHAGSSLTEFLFEPFKTSELLFYSCAQSSSWLSPAFFRWRQIGPK